MNRKYLLLNVLLILLLLTSCSIGMSAEEKLNQNLIRNGVEITKKIKQLAEQHDYYASLEDYYDLRPVMKEMAESDYGIPENVYKLNLTDEIISDIMHIAYPVEKIPDIVFELSKHTVQSYLFAFEINYDEEYEVMKASNYVSLGESYPEPRGWENNVIFILQYPGKYSSVVSFVNSGDDIITSSAQFVRNSDRDMLDVLEAAYGISKSEFEHIANSELKALLD